MVDACQHAFLADTGNTDDMTLLPELIACRQNRVTYLGPLTSCCTCLLRCMVSMTTLSTSSLVDVK